MATPTYVPLGTITLSSADSEIVFSSIPATYRDLVVVFSGTQTAQNFGHVIRVNGSSTSYSWVGMYANGSSFFSGANGSLTYGLISPSSPGTAVHNFIVHIMDYSATDKHKTILVRSNDSFVSAMANRWASTDAITSVTLLNSGADSYDAGSTFSLFGIAG